MNTQTCDFAEQGSPEWKQARCGNITGSRCYDMAARTEDGKRYLKKRNQYRDELICERLTGHPHPHYVSPEMQWGIEQEQFARAAYELERDLMVETCGFILHPEVDNFGASPDGLVGDDGLVQIKCPTTATHLNWMLKGEIPLEHAPQMLAEMSVTGRDWCDFVSYHPWMPPHLQIFVRRFVRNNRDVGVLERAVREFDDEIESVLARLPRGPQNVVNILDYKNGDEVEL